MHGTLVDNSFTAFAVGACAKGASSGHKIVKVMERDATVSYESERN